MAQRLSSERVAPFLLILARNNFETTCTSIDQ